MKKPTIVAHRGLHQHHTENTLPALLAAWKAGIEWCEIDVRGSIEHQPFLLHDETLDRTTRGVGLIADTPAAVLKKLGVNSLVEVIQAMPAGAKLLIEIKPGVASDVVRRTLEQCDPKTCMVQSFDQQILTEATQVREDVPKALLLDDASSSTTLWPAVNARHDTLIEGIVKDFRGRDIVIGAWTVNKPPDIERIVALGIDTIITDEPLLARDICKKIG